MSHSLNANGDGHQWGLWMDALGKLIYRQVAEAKVDATGDGGHIKIFISISL